MNFAYLALGAAFLATGCATLDKAPTVDLKQGRGGRTVAVFGLDIGGGNADLFDIGCNLEFMPLTKNAQTLNFIVKTSDTVSAVEAAPGKYSLKTISCGPSRNWEMSDAQAAMITVYRDKVNFVGRLRLRAENMRISYGLESSRVPVRDSLNNVLKLASAEIENDLVAGPTGKPIKKAMLDSEPKTGFRMQWRGAVSFNDQALMDALDGCARTENYGNPVLVGSSSWKASFGKNGKLTELKEIHTNTYSDTFLTCVKDSLTKFHAKAGLPLELSLEY